ncbi:MAG: T9SS type A sorting domain-containing protein [Rhizobacter sp.]|nr:T9SS type A sorting domain-containing protein [Chlorobiales bacterium]
MRHPLFFRRLAVVSIVLLTIAHATVAGAWFSGITGRTKKNSSGCTCHGTVSAAAAVTASISGPASLAAGETATYTLTVSGGPAVKAGVNIATINGELGTVSTELQKLSNELTHVGGVPIAFSGGSASVQFSYTAPSTAGSDTIYANGNSTNDDGGNYGDEWNFAPNFPITVGTSGAADEAASLREFQLKQNYPNPFNPNTVVSYRLSVVSQVELKVFDVSGKEVATLVRARQAAGSYSVRFGAAGLPSGIYFYKLQAGDFADTKKMLLVK